LWQYSIVTRKYEMTKRAAQVEHTRLRITEAAMELHGTVGPARTTITAVAERAGVDRLTVYRHFPDEDALFHACSSHWLALNPRPDTARWRSIDDPEQRLRSALGELYPWYRQTRPMLEHVRRDATLVPALAESRRGWDAYADAAARVLRRGWGARGKAATLLDAALAHALDFGTWLSLRQQGLPDADAAELMVRLVTATAGPSAGGATGGSGGRRRRASSAPTPRP
jgi:AcrR family transcriptional regulator